MHFLLFGLYHNLNCLKNIHIYFKCETLKTQKWKHRLTNLLVYTILKHGKEFFFS